MTKRSPVTPSLSVRLLRAGLAGLGLVCAVAASAVGCLDRPVSPASPNTTNVFVQDIQQSTVDKIDLLFMIDNSISMADKQAILAEAVPQLVNRLIQPATDPATGKPEFKAVVDIHVGVVTSSLGGHGGDQCSPTGPASNPSQYDNGKLLPAVRPGLPSYQSLGFLWWDPTGAKATPPGEANPGTFISNFSQHVTTAGETGCGYEASLEAWYRFLVDPAPPANVVVNPATNLAEIQGQDDVVLQQRKDFLRPNSLVSVIMLTDENDCSTVDGGFNWIASQTSNPNNTPFHLPRGTAACNTNPNDPCCRSCSSAEGSPPTGCTDLASDPECSKGLHDDASDHPNLRCWEQRKRFGIDFLYPTRRYVEALTQPLICPAWDGNGPLCTKEQRVPNPLFSGSAEGGATSRDFNLVYLAAIVGVPWQDIADANSLTGPGLKYLSSSELAAQGRWDWLTPKCLEQANTDELPRSINVCNKWDLNDQPDDPLMVESSAPRSGAHPSGNALWGIQPESAGPLANEINGHEWLTAAGDLQYSCIFPLNPPKDCSTVTGPGCDCDDVGTGYTANNPLCQGGGGYTKQQIYAKAFPGTRHLQVLRDFGQNSIVASICPKVTDPGQPGYGYNPAVDAIIERLKEALSVQCINRPVDVKPDGSVACSIVEVLPSTGGACAPCDPNNNRTELSANPDDAKLVQPVLKRLGDKAVCGPNSATKVPCDTNNFCMCKIGFATDKNSCENADDATVQGVGWCYVDPFGDPPVGNPALVADCEPPRLLRFVGPETPASGSTVFIACLGAPLTQTLDSGAVP